MWAIAKGRFKSLALVPLVSTLLAAACALCAISAYGEETPSASARDVVDITFRLEKDAPATGAVNEEQDWRKVETVSGASELDAVGDDAAESDGMPFSYIEFNGADCDKIEFSIKTRSSDWTGWSKGNAEQRRVSDGDAPVQCVRLRLASDDTGEYAIAYRVHVAGSGWLGWCAGEDVAGCETDGAVVDDLEVVIVEKGEGNELATFFSGQEKAAYVGFNNVGDAMEANQANPEDSVDSSALASTGLPAARPSASSATTASVSYRAHVQNIGWQRYVSDGETAGTTGRGLRVEALSLKVAGVNGGIRYRAHVQNVGWQGWHADGEDCGTTGRDLRVEALQVELTGAASANYDVYYRTHVQNVGWTSWSKNGATSGTTGRGLRVEAVQVLLVKHGQAIPTGDGAAYSKLANATYSSPTIRYQAHVQSVGWQAETNDGNMAGTQGRSLRLEALRASVAGVSGGLQYRAHVQNIGWQSWKKDGAIAGTEGQGLRMEALEVQLTGAIASSYDVYYRVHVSDIGWMAWAKNGETAGTVGLGRRIEAVQMKLVKKGSPAPSGEGEKASYPSIYAPEVTYATSAVVGDWQTAVKDGEVSGTTGKSLSIGRLRVQLSSPSSYGGIKYQVSTDGTNWSNAVSDGGDAGVSGSTLKAVRLSLTGAAAKYCDVWYRVHVSNIGWLGWTRNGCDAGTEISSNAIEAIQVVVKLKGSSAPGSTVKPFAYQDLLNGIDIASHQAGIDVANVSADFVFIKATQGTWYKNQLPSKGYDYAAWGDKTLASGRLLGFYHYAEGGDPIKEAEYFYNAVKAYKGRAAVALDWEGQDNKLFDTGFDVQWCKRFLDRIAELMEAKPLIYMSKSTTRMYDWSSVATSYPLWVAQYASNNTTGYQSNPWTDSYSFGAWTKPLIFQYSATGRVNGYKGDLDLDLFYGSRNSWVALQ